MIRNNIFCLFLLCWTSNSIFAVEPPYTKYRNYRMEVVEIFEAEMLREFNLKLMGNWGTYEKKIKDMSFTFNVDRRATLEEARAIEVAAITKFLQIINTHTQIQPFLKDHPFTSKNVSIEITFWSPNLNYSDGQVYRLYYVPERDLIFYDSKDPLTGDLITLLEEPFETAVKLAEDSNLKYPFEHQTNELESTRDQLFADYIEKMYRECQIHCTGIGAKGELAEIGACFTATFRAHVEDTRPVILFAIEKLLTAINANEKLKPYLSAKPFGAERLKISIHFQDENGFNYHDGSLEKVVLEGNVITYYREKFSPEWGPPVVAKETYQEALKNVENKHSFK